LTVYIPEEKISEIKHAADIVDVVSEVVALKKTGKNYLGLCPFHSEKTPSFSVSPEKQIFYCFGCGEGGNIFSFLMKQEGVTFPEAARALSRRYGIELPTRTMSPEQKRRMSQREHLLAVNKQAMDFFHDFLLKAPGGEKARAYLSGRGLTAESIERFKLGFAPKSWDRLLQFFSQKGIPLNLIEKSGLIVPRKSNSGYYDRFRDRIIFPIFDLSGQTIGFGGRILDDSTPKYLNSPETPVYSKSRSLYGIYQAKSRCREKETVYIVEGYTDLLALHQHGIDNTVATLGTALTSDHVRMLKGLTGTAGKVILVFDSDDAGIKAARRCIEVFDKEYVNARILVLPTGHDPDSYLSEFGVDLFLETAEKHTMGIMSFLIGSAVERHGLTMEGKIRVLADMVRPLAQIADKVERSIYIKELSERIQIDESAIYEKIRESAGPAAEARQAKRTRNGAQKSFGSGESRLERRIIAMMLQYPMIVAEINRRGLIDHFSNHELKSLGQVIMAQVEHSETNVSDIIASIEDSAQKSLTAALAMGEEIWDYEGCLRLINQFMASKDRRSNRLLNEIKAAEEKKDFELLNKLLQEKQVRARKGTSQPE